MLVKGGRGVMESFCHVGRLGGRAVWPRFLMAFDGSAGGTVVRRCTPCAAFGLPRGTGNLSSLAATNPAYGPTARQFRRTGPSASSVDRHWCLLALLALSRETPIQAHAWFCASTYDDRLSMWPLFAHGDGYGLPHDARPFAGPEGLASPGVR